MLLENMSDKKKNTCLLKIIFTFAKKRVSFYFISKNKSFIIEKKHFHTSCPTNHCN